MLASVVLPNWASRSRSPTYNNSASIVPIRVQYLHPNATLALAVAIYGFQVISSPRCALHHTPRRRAGPLPDLSSVPARHNGNGCDRELQCSTLIANHSIPRMHSSRFRFHSSASTSSPHQAQAVMVRVLSESRTEDVQHEPTTTATRR